jgi:superfamily II DNA or RNA helicase
MTLRDYQEKAIKELGQLARVHRRIVFQLATGGGKTITFSAIAKRYVEKSNKPVLIIVHRKELLKQTVRNIPGAEPITAGSKPKKAMIYVAMVESLKNRLPGYLGMVIVDECHILSFAKIYERFPTQLIIGFTATPLTASKSKPLKRYFDSIVTSIDIPELIESGSLCQNETWAFEDTVDAAKLTIKNGDYDQKQLGAAYSAPKYIRKTIDAYIEKALDKKTLIFNCNIEHSLAVTQAFVDAGFNARHLDSNSKDREETLEWFRVTPDAILNSIGILTTGFDEPSVECIIVNKATLSMPLWLQMCGRGSRPFQNKTHFTILDLGANSIQHGDWNARRNWKQIFHHPKEAGSGTAPVKDA